MTLTNQDLGASFTEEFLEHFGVKGMRWGVRKRDTTPTDVALRAKPGKRIKAKGGKFQPPHEDALRVATSKQKARKSTVDSLSTKELQELVNRMNLEQQLVRLDPASVGTGKAITNSLLNGQTAKTVFNGGVALAELTGKATNPHAALAIGIGKALTGGSKKKKR